MSFEVKYETVITASQDIRQSATTIKGQLDSLHSRVKRVVATWDGEAQKAFHATQTGWNNDVENLHNKLIAIANALQNATDGYKSTDKAAAAQFHM